MTKKELWLRLWAYHFDHIVPPNLWEQLEAKFGKTDASTKAFAHKLAGKMGWRKDFALLAVAEYKKFVYLGVVSDFVVTPPQVIDQVWHQHILFSKAYRSFCEEVIEYEFDHHPELVSLDDQTATYHAQYQDTLELYQKEFGFEPPASIWGQPKFDEEVVRKEKQSKKKTPAYSDVGSTTYYTDTPLYQTFDGNAGESFAEVADFAGFDGGDSGGAGASGDWGDSNSSDSSDSGSSDSSCSSGCSSCGGGGD